jgi:hypothetical protein
VRADFDNDGFADLAVGAPTESIGTIGGTGAVSVLYGTASRLTGSGSQLFTQDTPGVPGAAEPGDQFGSALAAGDFNGDAFADLAVAADLEDAGTTRDAGAVTLLYGSAGGLITTGSQLFTQVAGAAEGGDRFGFALAAGNFNNDGFADLAAGAPLENVGTTADAGAVSILPGSAGGLTASGGQIHTERSFTGPQPGDQFGSALAAGDFNNDAFVDLGVGVPFEGGAGGGAVNAFYGGSGGLFATFEDLLGLPGSRAFSAGDFDNDGFADLAAGRPFADVGASVDAGAVSVLYGDVLLGIPVTANSSPRTLRALAAVPSQATTWVLPSSPRTRARDHVGTASGPGWRWLSQPSGAMTTAGAVGFPSPMAPTFRWIRVARGGSTRVASAAKRDSPANHRRQRTPGRPRHMAGQVPDRPDLRYGPVVSVACVSNATLREDQDRLRSPPEAARTASPPRSRTRRCINRAKRTTRPGRSTPPEGA